MFDCLRFTLSQILHLYLCTSLLILCHWITSFSPSAAALAAPSFILLLVTLSPSPPSISGVLHKSSCHIDWLNEEGWGVGGVCVCGGGDATVCSTLLPTRSPHSSTLLFSPPHSLFNFPWFPSSPPFFPPLPLSEFILPVLLLLSSFFFFSPSLSWLFCLLPRSSGSFGCAACED